MSYAHQFPYNLEKLFAYRTGLPKVASSKALRCFDTGVRWKLRGPTAYRNLIPKILPIVRHALLQSMPQRHRHVFK